MTSLIKLMRQWGCASLFLFASLGVQAAPIPLSLGTPDLLVSDINAEYAGGTLSLSSAGFSAATINPPGGAAGLITNNASYVLSAIVSSTGVLTSGTVSIMDGATTLLAGTITQFGFESTGGAAFGAAGFTNLEFLINVTNSSVGIGPVAGISWSGNIAGDSTAFRGSGNTNNANITPPGQVPEPATLALLGLGCLALGRRFSRS